MSQLRLDEDAEWAVPKRKRNTTFIGTLPSPIWTETKAQLIAQYLRLFLYVTKHGTYIDGFSGPQYAGKEDAWAAKLVLEVEPKWMRKFYLCELSEASFTAIDALATSQPKIPRRSVTTHHGDFNDWLPRLLAEFPISDKTAAFALLDQRSTECHWRTVEALAAHKKAGRKVELFYFFPTGWLHRTIAGNTRTLQPLDDWWGDRSWESLTGMKGYQAADKMSERIRDLGYADVRAWPIMKRSGGHGRTMYHMIHATDHEEAPKLMYRAYRHLVATPQEAEQLVFWERENPPNPSD